MHKLVLLLTISFFVFILWVIYMANTGQSSLFFGLVKALPYGDKIGHVFLFGFLTLGANVATKFKVVKIRNINVLLGTAVVTLFVLIEEFSQHFSATRTFDIQDLMADAVGIIIFTVISLKMKNKLFEQVT